MNKHALLSFKVDGGHYRLLIDEERTEGLDLYLVRYDPFRVEYVERLGPEMWGTVLRAMAQPSRNAGFLDSVNYAEKWRTISMATKTTRYVLLSPRAAVEVGSKVRMFLLEEPSGQDLQSTQPRWVETIGYGAQLWILSVIRMLVETP